MTDPVDPPAPDPKDGADPTDDTFDAERAKAKIAKANSEAKALRDRLRAAEEKAARLDEIENEGKSELEKLTAKVAESERKAQEAESRAMRAEVAASKGLTPAQAKRLVGDSLEELEADADDLLASFQPQEGDQEPPHEGKPRAHLRGGTDPTTPLNGDPLLSAVKGKLGIR